MGGFTTDFETGLLDDFDFTITKAEFAPDQKYNNGETILLKLEGTTDSLDVPETHVWLTVGKGWVSKDGGVTIVHESGKADKYFNRSSMYAKWIQRCIDDFNIGDLLNERGNPWTAKTWVGLKFHLKNEVQEYGNGINPSSKLLPVAFVGIADGSELAAVSSGGSGSSSASGELSPADKIAAAKAKAAAAKAGGGLKDRVIEVLKAHDSFEAAQSAALELDGVTDDDDLLSSLMDESGLWAEVNA